MGKLIDQVQNYPYSGGSVAQSNRMLLDGRFMLRPQQATDHLKQLYEISKDVYFYNELGANSNKWQELLRKDEVFQLLLALHLSPSELNTFFTELPQLNGFNSDNEIGQEEYEVLAYQRSQIIQYLFSLFSDIHSNINDSFKAVVKQLLIDGHASRIFPRFLKLYDECMAGGTPLVKAANRKRVDGFDDISFPVLFDHDGMNALGKNFSIDAVSSMLVIYSNDYDKIKAANEHLATIFRVLMQVLQRFQQWAKDTLNASLNSSDAHEPHVALLIVFSKLMSFYDARYNQLIGENTAFVYNTILGLKKQPILPDTALIWIELAKNVTRHFLPAGSLFKAGKNSLNKPVFYRLERDTVLNSARIDVIKSSVRLIKRQEVVGVTGVNNASAEEWKVNGAWVPFNDMCEAYTGLAFESKMLKNMGRKGSRIHFNLEFQEAVPSNSVLTGKVNVELLLDDGSAEIAKLDSVTISGYTWSVGILIEKDIEGRIRDGINVKLLLASPSVVEEKDSDYLELYQFLQRTPIMKLTAHVAKESVKPKAIKTASGVFDGSASFVAFGARSKSGASFVIRDELLAYGKQADITMVFSEGLKSVVLLRVDEEDATRSLEANSKIAILRNCQLGSHHSQIEIQLESDIKESSGRSEISLPLVVKSISLDVELEEQVYVNNQSDRPVRYVERVSARPRWIAPLWMPTHVKSLLKERLYKQFTDFRVVNLFFYTNNLMAHVYPLGEIRVRDLEICFLPDYSKQKYLEYPAELCIGLKNVEPGQSLSLLFDMAEETAGQSLEEPRIEWFYVKEENLVPVDVNKLTDTTRNLLQTGLIQLMLPEDATHSSSLIKGDGLYWLVARSDGNYDLTANVKGIYVNGFAVRRVLNEENTESKRSVAASTIENLFPKTANIKSVQQPAPSKDGREPETDIHYFDRVSKRLRHKNRAVQQWDIEQMIIDHFNFVYRSVCLNHAEYDDGTGSIFVSPAHALVVLIPYYPLNPEQVHFRPAIALSKLIEVQHWLKGRSSPFLEVKVINAPWDEIRIEVEVMMNPGYLDQQFYKEQLDLDIKKFLAPWAFEVREGPKMQNVLYAATLIDYIDELEYVHHIVNMSMFRNNLAVYDMIKPSSAIHLLTSAEQHIVNVCEYEDQ